MAEHKVFKRFFNHSEKLDDCKIFADLSTQANTGEIFPAIRENHIDFYYSGQRVVRRSPNGYRSNLFFLTGEKDKNSKEASFKELPYTSGSGNQNMRGMLDLCPTHAFQNSREAFQLAKIYQHYSFLNQKKSSESPILIDVEARFGPLVSSGAETVPSCMIDLVFLLPNRNELLFVEAKRRKDTRIRSKYGSPHVVLQVHDYEEQIMNRESEIKDSYKEASKVMSKIFGRSFPAPVRILPRVPILVVEEPFEEGMPLPVINKSNDSWIDPFLRESAPQDCLIEERPWEKADKNGNVKSGVVLILDGRAIFHDPKRNMKKLGESLNKLADMIR